MMMNSRAFALALVALSGLALAACDREPDANSTRAVVEKDGVRTTVEIEDAWCRPTPNGAQAGACYLKIESSVANRITGVATPMAANAMVHDMTMANGMMAMTELANGLPLAAGQEVELEPGGRHLMLMGLTAPLTEGTSVPLTLTFSATPAMTVQAAVRQPKP